MVVVSGLCQPRSGLGDGGDHLLDFSAFSLFRLLGGKMESSKHAVNSRSFFDVPSQTVISMGTPYTVEWEHRLSFDPGV